MATAATRPASSSSRSRSNTNTKIGTNTAKKMVSSPIDVEVVSRGDTATQAMTPSPPDERPQQQEGADNNGISFGPRRARRAVSEDFVPQQQTPPSFPPTQISYSNPPMGSQLPPPVPNYANQQQPFGGLPPTQHSHHRVRSWSGNHNVPPPFAMPPPLQVGSPSNQHLPPLSPFPPVWVGGPPPTSANHLSYSPSSSAGGHGPSPPSFSLDPNMMGMPQQHHQHQLPQPRGSGIVPRKPEHRRFHSHTGAISTSPSQSDDSIGGGSQTFSPREDFMKMFSGQGGGSSNGSLSGHRRSRSNISQNSRRAPSPSHRSRAPSYDPILLQQPLNGGGGLGVYGMNPPPPPNPLTMMNNPYHTFTPQTRTPRRVRSGSTDDSSAGGEAVFFHNNRKAKKDGHSKQHMRQMSAQLFMEEFKGVEQMPACRDIVWLMLFVFHILGIVYLGNTYGFEALRGGAHTEEEGVQSGLISSDDEILATLMPSHDSFSSNMSSSTMTISYTNLLWITCLSGSFSILASAGTLLLMTRLAKQLVVQAALVVTATLSLAWGTIGVGLSPRKIVPVTGILALLFCVAYSFIVWDRIPFAAANLNAGLNGIKANPGAVYVAFLFQFLALGWSVYFVYVSVGVYDAMEVGDIDVSDTIKVLVYSGLGFSYYWTLQVFLNIVQVTIAGVIGKWWFTVDGDTSTRHEDLQRSFFRSMFYSVGSVCLGSLIVGPVRLLRQLSAFFRPHEEGSSLMCLHECTYWVQSCLCSCVDFLADRFNSWAFTYVGLFSYNLVDAGLHSTELFERRGWSTIVSDDLVPNVLLMTSIVIGGATGCVAHLIENFETLALTNLNEPVTTSFIVGASVGLVVSSILFGIINSSVQAVICCFAASPVDFERTHPELSQEMRTAWREVWPGCMDLLDMRLAVAAYRDPTMGTTGMGEHHPLLG